MVAAAFGAVFLIPYQAAVERAPRGSAIASMLLCAAAFNTIVALVRDRRLWPKDRIGLYAALFLSVTTIAGNTAIALSLPAIGAGMTSVVLKAQVVLTPVIGFIAIRERVSRHLVLGVLFASCGFLIMRYGAVASEFVFPIWALLAAAVFAAMQVGTRYFIHRIPVATVNALRLWVAAGAMFAAPTAYGGASFVPDPELWLFAAMAGVIGPGLSRLCLMFAVRHVTASMTALLGLVGPVFAFVVAFLAFGDRPTTVEIAGAAVILAGVAWPMMRDR